MGRPWEIFAEGVASAAAGDTPGHCSECPRFGGGLPLAQRRGAEDAPGFTIHQQQTLPCQESPVDVRKRHTAFPGAVSRRPRARPAGTAERSPPRSHVLAIRLGSAVKDCEPAVGKRADLHRAPAGHTSHYADVLLTASAVL